MNLEIRIKKLCEERKISIRKLAIKIGIAEQTLHRNLRRGSMETKYLEKMSEVFGITPSQILDFTSDTPIVANEPEIRFKTSSAAKEYTALLEELREVNLENRELNKKLREMEEEMKQLKIKVLPSNQKSSAEK